MAQRPFPLPVQADKRVSQVSQISDFSVNSNGSDARRHKAHIGPWKLGRTLGRGSSGESSFSPPSLVLERPFVDVLSQVVSVWPNMPSRASWPPSRLSRSSAPRPYKRTGRVDPREGSADCRTASSGKSSS